MNILKFNKFERIAGLFVAVAIFGFFLSMISVAVKQGWFERKVYWSTSFVNADGIHPGTVVQIQGLKAGSVQEISLTSDNRIEVKFYVLSKFADKIKQDSVAQLIRPFVIGERVIDVAVGSAQAPPLAAEEVVASKETIDLMTLMSGRNLGETLSTMNNMVDNLRHLAEAFLDKNRTQSFVNAFDQVEPLLKNLNIMSVEVVKLSRQATRNDNLGVVLGQLATTTKELNALIPEMNRQAPMVAKDVTQLVANLAILTHEFKVIIPALAEVAPDLPHASRRAVEALDEAVVLIKAMQKSMFVRGSAEEVRKEEAEAAKNKKHMPASEK